MSDGQLNEISVTIGQLQADVRNVASTQERIFNYIKNQSDEMRKGLTDHAASDAAAFKVLEDKVDDLNSFKNKVYAIAALIGTSAAGFWSYIWKKLGA